MFRKYFLFIYCLTTLSGCFILQTKSPMTEKFDKLSFMLGEWRDTHHGSGLTEIWKRQNDRQFFGQGLVIQNGDTLFSERTFIEVLEGDIFYRVQIGKRKPVLFKMTFLTDSEVVFENPEHDNPKKIKYKIEPNQILHATTEGEENGKIVTEDFVMAKVK